MCEVINSYPSCHAKAAIGLAPLSSGNASKHCFNVQATWTVVQQPGLISQHCSGRPPSRCVACEPYNCAKHFQMLCMIDKFPNLNLKLSWLCALQGLQLLTWTMTDCKQCAPRCPSRSTELRAEYSWQGRSANRCCVSYAVATKL